MLAMDACHPSWQLPIQQQPTVVEGARCLGGRRCSALGKECRRWLIRELSHQRRLLHRMRLLLLLLLLLLLYLLCLHQQLGVCPQPLAGRLIPQWHCWLEMLWLWRCMVLLLLHWRRLLLQRLGSRGMLGRHLLQSYCSCQGALVACCMRCLLRLPQRLLPPKATTCRHLLPRLLLLLPLQRILL